MYRVSFHTTWDESDEAFLESIRRQTPGDSGKWGSIEGITDPSVADYHVVFNQPRSDLDPSKTLLFSAEPPVSDLYRFQDTRDLGGAFPIESHHKPQRWWIERTYEELTTGDTPTKSRDISWITTDKGRGAGDVVRWIRRISRKLGWEEVSRRGKPLVGTGPTDGHVQRMAFYDRLKGSRPELLDLYGRGDFEEPHYRGELDDKWEGLRDYRYSIAIENYRGPNYFSEKLTDALLAWCMPIYWGCTNLPEYLPEDSYVWIDIDDPAAPRRVEEIVESDLREQNLDAIAEARELLLDRYQIWPTVERAIEDYEATG